MAQIRSVSFGHPLWRLVLVNNTTVVLSSDWKMNAGRGIITKEKWEKQDDSQWLLEEDDFGIQEQY